MKKAMLLPLILVAILALPAIWTRVLAQEQAGQPQAGVAAPANENLQKGIQLNTAKQYSQAETVLRAAVAAHPENLEAHLQLAIALFEQGKTAEASTELDAAAPLAQVTPKQQADYYQYRGAVYAKQEKWNEAVQNLEKAIQLDPKQPYNHYYIGVAYSKLKRPDKMVEHLQMFLKLAPNAPEAPKCRALLRAIQ
jgi:tetratricopeptide (TPR) repeat protein